MSLLFIFFFFPRSEWSAVEALEALRRGHRCTVERVKVQSRQCKRSAWSECLTATPRRPLNQALMWSHAADAGISRAL